jgi:hypothetical protein
MHDIRSTLVGVSQVHKYLSIDTAAKGLASAGVKSRKESRYMDSDSVMVNFDWVTSEGLRAKNCPTNLSGVPCIGCRVDRVLILSPSASVHHRLVLAGLFTFASRTIALCALQ